MVALQLTVTNPQTGATYSNAYGQLDDVEIDLSQGIIGPLLNWYLSETEAKDPTKKPIRYDGTIRLSPVLTSLPDPAFVAALETACGNGKITSPLDALSMALCLLLAELPQYEGAVIV